MDTVTMYAFTVLLVHLYLVRTVVLEQPASTTTAFNTSNGSTNGKVHVYKYSAVVLTGQNEPIPYTSKFQIQGKLLKRSDNSDPNLNFTNYMKFHDIKHTIFNGPDSDAAHGQFQILNDTIKDFEEPIIVVSDQFNKLQGIKIQDKESVWSKNMKKSLASIMQIEFKQFEMHENLKPTAFQTTEKTIHGNCKVNYNVYTDSRRGKKWYYVRKVYEPRSCSEYVQYAVSDENILDGEIKLEENLITSAERIYEFEYVNNEFLMTKVLAHEELNYLPSSHKSSRIQFIKTNQTFEFENIMDISALNIPVIDFKRIEVNSDINFDKTEYMPNISIAEEHFIRHKRNLTDLMTEVQELLIELVDYLKENHIKMHDDMHKNQENIFIKLQRSMTHLDSESMYIIYKKLKTEFEKEQTTRNIFLEMIPHTGTYAAWNFTKHIINNHEVADEIAVNMLTNLPMYVFNPKEEFVKEMVDFMHFDRNATSNLIRQAGILCFSILLHKTYKNIGNDIPVFLQEQLDYFNERIKLEPTCQLKILYIMAMRNVEVGGIYKYLAPIVRGEDIFIVNKDNVKPEKYRIAAMWSVAKSISYDKELTYNLFWPIFSNDTQTLSMRITAYEFLVSRNPLLDMNLLMNVHWLMLNESNAHVFNYHYTTLKSMAKSTNPYMKRTSELMRQVLRITERRKILSTTLSNANIFDYFNTKYDHGKIFKIGITFNEATGFPQFGYSEEISTFGSRATLTTGLYWSIEGISLHTMAALFKNFLKEQTLYEISNNNVKDLLRQTYGHRLLEKEIRVELWTMDKCYVNFFFEISLSEFLTQYIDNYLPMNFMDEEENFNLLDISFFNHYKMVVATDIGIPALFYNTVPEMSYMKLNPNIRLFKTILTMRFKFEFKFYRYNSYKMKFYNPFVDVVHSVERGVIVDVSLPFDVTIGLNLETYNIKIILPKMPETKFSVAGIKVYSSDRVKIANDYTNALKIYCPDCKNIEMIIKNSMNDTMYDYVANSMDTGLEYKYTIFNCENIALPGIDTEELYRIFNMLKNNANDDIWEMYKMIIDQGLSNFMNDLYVNNCGVILKVSPSTIYSTSHIEIYWRFNIQKFGSDFRLNIRGSSDTKMASTNETVRFWDLNMNADFSQFFKDLKLQLTRKTKGDKNLMICLDIQKEYPNYITDIKEMKHETNTQMTFAMGYSDNTICNGTFMNITIKGELLDEQLEQTNMSEKSGSCFKNPLNPFDFDIGQRFDWNCIYQAIKATTMKKYSINISYKKIPYEVFTTLIMLDEFLRLDNLSRIIYKPVHAENGTIKIIITYSPDNNYGNISVINPFFSYELRRALYLSSDEEDRQIDLTLDNIGFSTNFLVGYCNGKIRPCIAHSNDVITDLNQTVTMEFKDWTLMIGDYELMTYAVFVKAVNDTKVAMKVHINMRVLEIQPGTLKPVVILDGTVIQNYENGILIPTSMYNEFYLKLMMINQLLVVETNGSFDCKIYYTPYNVVILPQIIFTSNIDGICGHMGSSAYVQQVPLVCSDC